MNTLTTTSGLMRGNWLMAEMHEDRPIKIESLKSEFINGWSCSRYYGIPITPEILAKAGFTLHTLGNTWQYDIYNADMESLGRDVCRIDCDFKDGVLMFKSRYEPEMYIRPLPHIKYLHELQNLTFCLTGKPLTIEL